MSHVYNSSSEITKIINCDPYFKKLLLNNSIIINNDNNNIYKNCNSVTVTKKQINIWYDILFLYNYSRFYATPFLVHLINEISDKISM